MQRHSSSNECVWLSSAGYESIKISHLCHFKVDIICFYCGLEGSILSMMCLNAFFVVVHDVFLFFPFFFDSSFTQYYSFRSPPLASPLYLKCRSKLCQRIITHFVTQAGGFCWKVQAILTFLMENIFSCHSGGGKRQSHLTFTLQRWYKSRSICRLLAVRLPVVSSTHLWGKNSAIRYDFKKSWY